jgi:hypothetical protein
MNPAITRTCVAAAIVIAAGVSACDKKAGTKARASLTPDDSAVVIGKAPAPPTGDPPGTTPVASNSTEVSKSVESVSMPQPGQPNDHSNVAPTPSQKAEHQDVLKSPDAAAQSNNGTENERKSQ